MNVMLTLPDGTRAQATDVTLRLMSREERLELCRTRVRATLARDAARLAARAPWGTWTDEEQ